LDLKCEQNSRTRNMRKLLVIVALVAIVALMVIQFGPGLVFR
jgi:hypothetical protein